MKILYVASKPIAADSLMLAEEIGELQRRFAAIQTERVEAVFLPEQKIETLPEEISKHRPDILHISAHGDTNVLTLSNAAGKEVALTGERLVKFLNREHPPRLIYLNACNSEKIAEEVSSVAAMAIGTTAPISNRSARAAALQFYDRVLQGRDVQEAFDVNQAIVETMQTGCSSVLWCRPGVDATVEVLQPVPRLVAKLGRRYRRRGGEWTYPISIGLAGCPSLTTQVVFFTDDESFIDGEDSFDDMSWIARCAPVRGLVWCEDVPDVYGDFRIFACGVCSSTATFSIASSLAEALDQWATKTQLDGVERRALDRDLGILRANDGAGLPSSKK